MPWAGIQLTPMKLNVDGCVGKQKNLKPERSNLNMAIFGSFLVSSKEQNTEYCIEIRSLSEHINSCTCQDYRTNRLGTCKHIEHVLCRLQRKQRKKYKEAIIEGSHAC
jgi:hypothetical protein